jgi:hypothetical protein
MNFILPQFIEMETKIVGPFTLRQFASIGAGTALCFVLYMLSTANVKVFPLPLCLALVVIIEGVAFALAFIKVGGINLPVVIKNYFMFSKAPKLFLWKKFESAVFVNPNQGIIKLTKAKTGKEPNLSQKSQLKNLRNIMETKSN